MISIEVKEFIHAAHKLPDSEHLVTKQCARLHGHTYMIVVGAMCEKQDMKGGMAVDFKGIKNIINELDHTYINEIFEASPGFQDKPTTAENIALYLKERIVYEYAFLKNLGVSVCEGYQGEKSNWIHV